MYNHSKTYQPAKDYARQTLTDETYRRLDAFRERCVEAFGRVLGKRYVAEQFDHFFFRDERAVREWEDFDLKMRGRRFEQFERALKHRVETVLRKEEAKARLLDRPAVNDDIPSRPRVEAKKVSVEGFVVQDERPASRDHCPGFRPCPYVSCRYHLYLDVTRRGRLRLNFPETEILDLEISCALDLAAGGPRTLEEIGTIMGGISRERVRQIEQAALNALRDQGGSTLADFLEDNYPGD